MSRWRFGAALLLAMALLFGPHHADARAGGSYGRGGGGSFTSQGSLGSRSFGFNGAQPLGRSMTPRPSPGYAGQPAYGSGMGYHPFLGGLAGGLFGSWIGSMLFPHWGMGGGYSHGFGSIFSWIIILGLIWMAIRFLMGRSLFRSGGAMGFGGMGLGGGMGGYGQQQAYAPSAPAGAPLSIVGSDYQAFEAILKTVQAAWSRADLSELRHVATPEMLSYFAEELAQNESQGVRNHVEQVELLRGDLREAWDEGRMQYATCDMRWRALDFTVRAGARPGEPQAIVGGDPQHPTEAEEVWTFTRSPGGQWLLSAVQQV